MLLFKLTAESTTSEEEETDADAEEKPKTKTVKEKTYDWEVLNDMKAIWLRNPKEVTDEEYSKFYHSLAKVNIYSHTYRYVCVMMGQERLKLIFIITQWRLPSLN